MKISVFELKKLKETLYLGQLLLFIFYIDYL